MSRAPDAELEGALAALPEVRRIFLRDFVVECDIGIHDHEKQGPQRLAINVDLYLMPHPPADDDIARVLDYDRIRDGIRAFVRGRHINLQETLVERLVELCFEFDEVIAVRASTAKLDVYEDAAAVGYEIFRTRQSRTPPLR